MSPGRQRRRRRAGALALAGAAALAALLAAARWRTWVAGLENHLNFSRAGRPGDACASAGCPPLTPEQANLLGWTTPSLSPRAYFRLPAAKKPGVTRVGLFGCSYVAGNEAAPGQDVATLLQRRLDAAGYRDVEVLNFGVMGYGLHQAHLLWSFLRDAYGLDVSVFLAMRFHRPRDTTFLQAETSYGPIHSRYVLEDGRTRLIPAAGDTPARRSALYYSWLAPWRYWRYDDKPPAWMRALLPAGRRWKLNPFYYRRSAGEQEALETYVALFRGAASRTRLVVDSDADDLTDLLRSGLGPQAGLFVTSPFWGVSWPDQELYYAPRFHLSALGNWTRAAVLFGALTGRPPSLELPSLAPLEDRAPGPRGPALNEAADVSVLAGALASDIFVYYEGCAGCLVSPGPDFKRDGVASLVVTDFGERPLIGLSAPLRDGEPVSLRLRLRGGEARAPVGALRTSDGVVGRLRLSSESYTGAGGAWTWEAPEGDYIRRASLRAPGGVSEVSLETATRRLLTGSVGPSGRIAWRPAEAPHFLYLRVPQEGWIDPPRYRSARTLDLALRRADGTEFRSPLFAIRWRRARLAVDALSPPLPRRRQTATMTARAP